jgi:uncharacterized protein YjbI with pentapeptide repeats
MNEPEPGRTRAAVVEPLRRPEVDDAREEPAPVAPEAPPAADDKALRGEIDHLQAAAEKASGHVRNLYLFFLSFGLYLAIIFGATTHEQLLRAAPVTLPLFNVELPLLGFFWVAPALFVLLHFNLLLQCRLLAGKVQRLDGAIGRLGDPQRQAVERARLDVFPLTQMLLGRQHGRLMRFLLWLIVVLTVLALPVLLLLFGQVRFLPYHDAATTMWHRVLVALDAVLILIFWRPIRHPEDRLLARPGRWFWHYGKVLPGTVTALALSWLILTFPGDESGDWGDPMEEWLLAIAPDRLIDLPQPVFGNLPASPVLWPTQYLFGRLPFLDRNLIVRDTNLVGSWPTQVQIDQYGDDLAWRNFGTPPDLRRRDLRYADLSQSIFVRADFRGSNLKGVVLEGTNLEYAYLEGVNLEGAGLRLDMFLIDLVSIKGCPPGGRFANLRHANCNNSSLKGVVFLCADLRDATFRNVDFQEAFVAHANFQRVDLTNTKFSGANIYGADLTGANLDGADFRGAKQLPWSERYRPERAK